MPHCAYDDATGGKPGMVVVEVPAKPQWREIRNVVLIGHERSSLFRLQLATGNSKLDLSGRGLSSVGRAPQWH